MSLRPDERQALGQIERALRGCDPKLAGMLSIFTRLTAHERMPPHEGPLTAQNTAALRLGGMPAQGTTSTPNRSHPNVGIVVFFAGMLIIILVVFGLQLAEA